MVSNSLPVAASTSSPAATRFGSSAVVDGCGLAVAGRVSSVPVASIAGVKAASGIPAVIASCVIRAGAFALTLRAALGSMAHCLL